MTVHIDLVGAVILVVGCLVARAIYQHTRPEQPPLSAGGPRQGKGDLVGAVGASTAVVTVLVLLLGGAAPTTPGGSPSQSPGPTATSPTPSSPSPSRR
ncbi:hypothetical protein ACFXDH_51290 [Streptomyces sp. NPDC059467]|uniref:hypothetical protein n=1 Tax=Streptomyces sp. NPDC059467 TaxID=3346844 RepID=UPI0036BE0D14